MSIVSFLSSGSCSEILYDVRCLSFFKIQTSNLSFIGWYNSDEVAIDKAKFHMARKLPAISIQLLNEVLFSSLRLRKLR